MGTTYGRKVLGNTGESGFGVIANQIGDADWKSGGVTLDWTTVTAVSGDTTYNDQITVLDGRKALRYGQVLCKITASGKYGPYDPAAADGRQLLVRGDSYIVNKTQLELAPFGVTTLPTDHVPVFDGGKVYLERILQSGVAAHSLALGPTLAELETVFPRLSYAR